MKSIYFMLFALAGITVMFSCTSDQEKNIRDYYVPFESLKEEGLVFEFRSSTSDSIPPRYWYYKTFETDTGTFIANSFYDYAFVNRQLVVEEVVDEGILAKQYQFMAIHPQQDGHTVVRAKLNDIGVFPFKVRKNGGVFVMGLEYDDPNDPKEHVKLIRERRYLKDTIYTYKGEDIPSVLFESKERRMFTHEVDGDFDHTDLAYEIYAKGYGLVAKSYSIGGVNMEYSLYDTYDLKEFEKKAAVYWGKEVDLDPLK